MRHNKNFNHLSRKKAHRDALLANMTIALIERKRIFTTLAKAKALRMYAEPLINRAVWCSATFRISMQSQSFSARSLRRSLTVRVVTHVSSRPATVWATTLRCA